MEETNNQTASPETPIKQQPNPKPKALVATSIIASIVAIVGIATSIYFYLDASNKATDNADLQAKIDLFESENNSATTIDPTSSTETSNNNASSSIPSSNEVATILEDKYEFSPKEVSLCIGAHDLICGIDNFDQDKKIQFVLAHAPETIFNNERYVDSPASYIRNIKYDDFNNLLSKYFGSSEKIEKKNYTFEGFLTSIEYLPENDSFDVVFKDGLGGITSSITLNKVIETTKTENGFSAILASATIDRAITTNGEPILNNYNGKQVYDVDFSSNYLDEIQESLSVYRFDFINEDGEYKIKSIEKIQ